MSMGKYNMLDTSSLSTNDLIEKTLKKGQNMYDTASQSQIDAKTGFNQLDTSSVQAVSQGADKLVALSGEGDSTAGGAVSGAASGASLGATVGGPYGAAIGGVIGGIAGGLSAKSKRKARNREIESNKVSNVGEIQQQNGINQANILQGLAANLSNTLV